MSSIFTRIIKGEIPCYKIAETQNFIAFLDVNPLKKGHTLVIPKMEVDYIFDLEDQLLADLHVFSKKVAKAIEKTIPCLRIGIAVIGLEVPHAHIHLVPLEDMGDLNFSNPRVQLTKEEFSTLAATIASNL
ncbi:MAG: HIT family protein [Bacteroidetes bacterium]|nr:HIT family protein [Bacteroidota bacterium]